jgi:hypothetical protein
VVQVAQLLASVVRICVGTQQIVRAPQSSRKLVLRYRRSLTG